MSSFGSTEKLTTQEAQDLDRYAKQLGLGDANPLNSSTQHLSHTKAEAEGSSPDFLRIIPRNDDAKRAFSELIDKRSAGELSEHHARYLVSHGKGPLGMSQSLPNLSGDDSTDVDSRGSQSIQQVNLGWFRVGFDCAMVATGAKWIIGRGAKLKTELLHRNVDILLAAPKSKYRKNLLATHAYLSLHLESGVWVITAAVGSSVEADEATASQSKVTVRVDDKDVPSEQFRCLSKPCTPLQIQGMEYLVEFTVTTFQHAKAYRETRDKALRSYKLEPPNTEFTGIPLDSDRRVGPLAVFSIGLGAGSYGSVYEGFDPVSGGLRAVKVFEVKKKGAKDALLPEIIMNDRFGNTPGLVRQYGWRNSNGGQEWDNVPYPLQVYLVLEKGQDFRRHKWAEYGSELSIMKLRLCRDLLRGLATIHAQGWIHRDITPQNLLFIAAKSNLSRPEPMRAVLCDFGKLSFSKTGTSTSLAAWEFLPPEVVQGAKHPYDQKIDIWMLALALFLTWYGAIPLAFPRHENQQLQINSIERIHAELGAQPSSALAKILRWMLNVNPKDRPTATMALNCPCFRNLDQNSRKLAKTEEGEVQASRAADSQGSIEL